jgi:D-alanyl-D-alanine endopeptidase (penicillin-binding protein 7)
VTTLTKSFYAGLLLSITQVCAASSDSYTVSKGDTLYSIASQYHTSVENIRNYNNLSSTRLRIGQEISIPSGLIASGSATKSISSSAVYIVRKGDTLSTIAAQFKVSMTSLRAANGLYRSLIRVGQKLTIPGKSVAAVNLAQSAPSYAANNYGVYVVKSGDSLSSIATSHGTNVNALARHNRLSINRPIHQGQRLSIPAQNITALRTVPRVTHSSIGNVRLASSSAIVVDVETGKVIYAKNADQVKPIASITKLMTAMVALDANLDLNEELVISDGDVDYLKKTTSRLPLGAKLKRYEMLRLALMSSENRAASALSRYYPGSKSAFIQAMNEKAKTLGMKNTRFVDATGLTPHNVSTATDLAKLVEASSHYSLIHEFTTTEAKDVAVRPRSAPLKYMNSNALVRAGQWDIDVSKTGYINEAGRCLVMKADVGHRPAVMILLDSNGKYSPVGDANRIKKWIESGAAGVNLASL